MQERKGANSIPRRVERVQKLASDSLGDSVSVVGPIQPQKPSRGVGCYLEASMGVLIFSRVLCLFFFFCKMETEGPSEVLISNGMKYIFIHRISAFSLFAKSKLEFLFMFLED